MKKSKNIEEYISHFSEDTQKLLEQVRATIKKAAPNAEEAIIYDIPTFKLNGNLVHFACYRNHIGFYPTPSGILEFQKEIANYKSSKGAVQFPLDQPLPLDLIFRIVKFRLAENLSRSKKK